MPNIASVLKDEIARIARKELRSETDALKKASARYRSEIAELKRRIAALEQQMKTARKHPPRSEQAPLEPAGNVRFSAKGLRSKRERLGLSAAGLATVLGVSAQTIYNWEAGKTRPRAEQLSAIAAMRKMGKREARERTRAVDRPQPGTVRASRNT